MKEELKNQFEDVFAEAQSTAEFLKSDRRILSARAAPFSS
jgi:hypothetical protein